VEDSEVVGAIGTVLLRIAGGGVPGKVSVAVRGTRETFIAYADSEVAAGTPIVVFNSRGDRQVDVMPAPWSPAE
jgi:hypothetical protein